MKNPPFIKITERHGLNVLIGKPAICVWETSITGYDVTLWQWHNGLETFTPEMSVFVPGRADAERISDRWHGVHVKAWFSRNESNSPTPI